MVGRCQAHVQQRDQRLTAGEDFRVGVEERQRLSDGLRSRVAKRPRLHDPPGPAARSTADTFIARRYADIRGRTHIRGETPPETPPNPTPEAPRTPKGLGTTEIISCFRMAKCET